MQYRFFWNTSCPLNKEQQDDLKKRIDFTLQCDYFYKVTQKETLNWNKLELNIVFTGDAEIHSLNSEYRKKNSPTDILTFPFELTNDGFDTPDIAELYISIDTAQANAKEHNVTLLDELSLLIIHGLLHAFHFDHETGEKDRKEMENHEKKLLECAGLRNIIPLTGYGS